MFVDKNKKQPDLSVALLDAVRGEVATLMQSQLFSFDCYKCSGLTRFGLLLFNYWHGAYLWDAPCCVGDGVLTPEVVGARDLGFIH